MSQVYDGWVSVYRSGTDYEAEIVRDRLDDSGIPAVVLSQRDHAFNLTHGDLAPVNVLVPEAQVRAAQHVLTAEPVSDEELARAAMSASPIDESAEERPTLESLIEASRESDDPGA